MRRRALFLVTVLLAVAGVSGGLAAGLEPGAAAPPFTLTSLDGTPVTLAGSLDGGPTVVVFFRADCSHCRRELPIVQKLLDEGTFPGIRVVAINVREAEDVVRPFVAELGLRFPVALDPAMEATRAYKVAIIPRMFFVRQDATLDRVLGVADEAAIREGFAALAASAAPRQKILLIVPSVERESGAVLVAAARRAGYAADVWDMDAQGAIPEAKLREYLKVPVVRCIPEDLPRYRIGTDEDVAWSGFLSDGGRVLLCGNDMARSAAKTDVMQYYLLTKYVRDDSGVLTVAGNPANPDFGSFRFTLREKTPEYGAVVPDVIVSDGAEAVPLMFYGDGAERSREVAALLVKT